MNLEQSANPLVRRYRGKHVIHSNNSGISLWTPIFIPKGDVSDSLSLSLSPHLPRSFSKTNTLTPNLNRPFIHVIDACLFNPTVHALAVQTHFNNTGQPQTPNPSHAPWAPSLELYHDSPIPTNRRERERERGLFVPLKHFELAEERVRTSEKKKRNLGFKSRWERIVIGSWNRFSYLRLRLGLGLELGLGLSYQKILVSSMNKKFLVRFTGKLAPKLSLHALKRFV